MARTSNFLSNDGMEEALG